MWWMSWEIIIWAVIFFRDMKLRIEWRILIIDFMCSMYKLLWFDKGSDRKATKNLIIQMNEDFIIHRLLIGSHWVKSIIPSWWPFFRNIFFCFLFVQDTIQVDSVFISINKITNTIFVLFSSPSFENKLLDQNKKKISVP